MDEVEEASKKGESVEIFIDTDGKKASFPATMDRMGRIQVPDFVRSRLGVAKVKMEAYVSIELKGELKGGLE